MGSYQDFSLKKDIYTVGEISSILKQVLESELFMDIKVRGEIVSKSEKNGNVYLTLIDTEEANSGMFKGKAVLKVNVFSWCDKYIKDEYKIGDEVVVSGSISYYPPFGQLSLNAKYLYLYGEGLELIKLKRLQEKLEKEGLFDQARKKPLPKTIRKIGIVTSSSGAAYHDIMETLSKKMPVSTVLFDALVQGEDAPKSLMRALDRAYKSDCDIIIFGRGGGSKTDLSCFNDEALVRKVASSNKPIISGIGHEIDTSLCDLAADIYAITPTEAANKALPDLTEVKDNLSQLANKLQHEGENNLALRTLEIRDLEQKLESYSPFSYLLSKENLIKGLKDNLDAALKGLISRKEIFLQQTNLRLTEAYPLNGLKEGTALVRKNGKGIKSKNDLLKGDEVELGFYDGSVGAIIK
jgi:exodeoxyribonuclease VII large subunit